MHVRQIQWLPAHIQEFDGLRGAAVLAVFCFHARFRVIGTVLFAPFSVGWAGVSLFFVLSGFLITSILWRAREGNSHRYFVNFYGRRALRILPLYILLIAICFLGPAWLLKPALQAFPKWKLLLYMAIFVQNLTHAQLAGAIEPTWSLAIEEQFYFLWAPVMKAIRSPHVLAAGLLAVIAASPAARYYWRGQLNPMHSLFHLDCIAFGSLIAVGVMACNWGRHVWLYLGIASAILGFGALYFVSGTPLQDSAIGLGLAGVVLIALVASSRPNPLTAFLRRGPLPFFGTVSYGLYLCHMPVIMSLGALYSYVDRTTGGHLRWANVSVVAVQLAISTAVAALLWFLLERRILQLKRHFQS